MGNSSGSKAQGEEDIDKYRISLDPYRISLDEVIGMGCFGQVLHAINIENGEKLAVKQIMSLAHEPKDNSEYLAKMNAISMTMKRIRHPHIVCFLDCKILKSSAWIFMPLCDGGDLRRFLSKNADMPNEKRFTIMYQLADAVSYLHSRNPPIIHRHIKPANILSTLKNGEDCMMLTDCWLAKFYDQNLNSPSFVGPEWFMNGPDGLMGAATEDIFSLGLIYSIILEYSSDNTSLFPASGNKLILYLKTLLTYKYILIYL